MVVCHAKIGPAQKWSIWPILAAKNGSPGPLLVAKNSSPLPIVVLDKQVQQTKTGPGDHFGSQKWSAVPIRVSMNGPASLGICK